MIMNRWRQLPQTKCVSLETGLYLSTIAVFEKR